MDRPSKLRLTFQSTNLLHFRGKNIIFKGSWKIQHLSQTVKDKEVNYVICRAPYLSKSNALLLTTLSTLSFECNELLLLILEVINYKD